MSPFIPSLSRRLQEYPAFFNRTTINWFDMWPLKVLKIERFLSCVMVLLSKETDWLSAKKCLGESTSLTNLEFLDKDSLCKTPIAKVGKFCLILLN